MASRTFERSPSRFFFVLQFLDLLLRGLPAAPLLPSVQCWDASDRNSDKYFYEPTFAHPVAARAEVPAYLVVLLSIPTFMVTRSRRCDAWWSASFRYLYRLRLRVVAVFVIAAASPASFA